MGDNSDYDSDNSYWCCTSSSKYKHLSHPEYTHPNPNLSETDLYQHEQDLNTNPNKYGDTDGEDKNHVEWEVNKGYKPMRTHLDRLRYLYTSSRGYAIYEWLTLRAGIP